jgi:hypothetical protein
MTTPRLVKDWFDNTTKANREAERVEVASACETFRQFVSQALTTTSFLDREPQVKGDEARVLLDVIETTGVGLEVFVDGCVATLRHDGVASVSCHVDGTSMRTYAKVRHTHDCVNNVYVS